MPVTSFVPAATFGVVAKKPKRKRRRRGRARARNHRRPRPKADVATRRVRAKLAAEIEAAFLRDALGEDANSIFQTVMGILLPEEHAGPVRVPAASVTAPGSPERLEVIGQRLAAGEVLHCGRDADPIRDDRLGLAGHVRRNGNALGPQITGWN